MVASWKGAWNLTSVLMLLTSCACLLATIISCMLIGQRKPFTRLVTSRFQCDKSLTRHTIYFDKISPKNPKHLTYVPYLHHYNPRFIYFLPTFWGPKTFFQGASFLKLWPYVWLVFKTGLWWCTYGKWFWNIQTTLYVGVSTWGTIHILRQHL